MNIGRFGLLCGVIVGLACATILRLAAVTSTSMSPTVKPNQHLILLRTGPLQALWRSFPGSTVNRGDLIILYGHDGAKEILKRVVAVAGDRIAIKEGILFRDGVPVPEPYAHHGRASLREADRWPLLGDRPEVTIPDGMIFVLGDNRADSADSRLWGPVGLSDVIAKVIMLLP